jgi:hypothetical protein
MPWSRHAGRHAGVQRSGRGESAGLNRTRGHHGGPPRAGTGGPPAQPQFLLLAAAVALVAVSGVSALETARDLHALLASARSAGPSCPAAPLCTARGGPVVVA